MQKQEAIHICSAAVHADRTFRGFKTHFVVSVGDKSHAIGEFRITGLMNSQGAGCDKYGARTMAQCLPLDPPPHAPKATVLRETLLRDRVNLRHGVAEVRHPRNSGQPAKSHADQMSRRHGIGGPQDLRPMLADHLKTRGNRAHEPSYPRIRQRHPAQVATAKTQVASRVQGESSAHRNSRGDLSELVGFGGGIGSRMDREHKRRPTVVA